MLETSYQQLKMSLQQIHSNDLGLEALESMVLKNKNALSLASDIAHNIVGRKIRFVGHSFNDELNTIREKTKASLSQDETKTCVKHLANLVREQIQTGNFVFEEQLADKTIKALVTATIAEKITDRTLVLKNKKNGLEKEYDALNILSDAEVKDLNSVVDGIFSENEIEKIINQKQQVTQEEKTDTVIVEDPESEIPTASEAQSVPIQSSPDLQKEPVEEKEAVKAAELLMTRAISSDVIESKKDPQEEIDTFKEEQLKKDKESDEKAAQIKRDAIKKEELRADVNTTEITQEEVEKSENIQSENENVT